ncbi:MAG: hypothetical protein WAT09_06495 [Paracoccaceae bacterium]
MQIKAISLCLATSALVTLGAPAFAQDTAGTNMTTEGTGQPGGAATLSMAHQLYEMGVASGDALTVLTAAKLAATVDLKDGAEIKKETTGEAAADDSEGAAEDPATAEMMFAMATELAADDEAMKAIISDAAAETSRGRIGGAVRWKSKLPKGQTDVWEVPFYGNSYAEVAVIGDGDANLDMIITDQNGNAICYDVSPSDQVYCDFVPAWDGYFYVTVQNVGRSRNSYYLLTN